MKRQMMLLILVALIALGLSGCVPNGTTGTPKPSIDIYTDTLPYTIEVREVAIDVAGIYFDETEDENGYDIWSCLALQFPKDMSERDIYFALKDDLRIMDVSWFATQNEDSFESADFGDNLYTKGYKLTDENLVLIPAELQYNGRYSIKEGEQKICISIYDLTKEETTVYDIYLKVVEDMFKTEAELMGD